MPFSNSSKRVLGILALLLLAPPILVSFLAQTPEPSPSPSGSPSPSPSPSPSRTPSPTPLPGAQNFHQWGSITVFNGLPSDSVRGITQTEDGVMWFGTDNGVARFDGRRVQNFVLGVGESNRVLALKASPNGLGLWVGTRAGAFEYDDGQFKLIPKTENLGITAIYFGRETLLGTDSGAVFHFRDPEPSPKRFNSETLVGADGTPIAITGLGELNRKILAATVERGVFVIGETNVSEYQTTPRPVAVNAIAEDGERIWVASDAPRTGSGVFVSAGERALNRIAAPTGKVLSLEVNDSGLWAGTERYGLFQIVDGKLKKSYTFENTSGGLRSNTVYTLFTDREGVLWIGTNRGASRFDRAGSFQQTVSDVPNSNFIRSLWRTDDTLFAGSNRGLFKYDGENWNRVPGFEEKAVYDFGERGGAMIFATSTGTYDSTGKLIATGDTRSIQNFGKTTYAAVRGRGVIDISSGNVVFPDETASSVFAGRDRLWIGTEGHGLFSFDGKTIKTEASPDELRSGTIWNVTQDPAGNVWIAGQHGVFRLSNGPVERVIEAEDVRDIYVDGAEVWAATTTRGLLHARVDEDFGWLVSTIGFEQGLPSEKAFAIAPGDGLLIGTNRGVVTYKPGTIAPKLIPVRILSQRVHDLSEARSIIPLEYPQNSLLVEVAGQSSRTFPEEFQYAFVLKNTKGEEIARQLSNDSQYAPTDLSPGEYAIEAIAFNRDLLASDPLTISFSVAKAPFPWTATALGVLLFIAVVGLVWAIIEHRRIVQRNRELAAARLDLANEAERERRRIARDLHDQTLADLRNLMMTTDKIPSAGSAVREEIESISTDIRRICEDLSPSVLENVGLVAALESLLSRTIENSKFVAAESLEERIAFPLNTQLQIYRIAQEVVTNIQRHSTATHVEMNVDVADAGEFVLTIRDDGSVFHPDGLERRGRGISNILARANLINGRAAWKESRRGGNVFSLKVGEGNGSG